MTPYEQFKADNQCEIEKMGHDADLAALSQKWLQRATDRRYSYHFEWLGRPIIQFPQDIVAFQELVWSVKPDVIVETGVAHGGSLILSASLLAMLDLCDAAANGTTLDPSKPKRRILGIDIDIRSHNREAIEAHPLSPYIELVEGSSLDRSVVEQAEAFAAGRETVLVALDSNHTHEHVARELEFYSPLVTPGSYCVVYDTLVEDMDDGSYPDRPWGKGDNPKTAVWDFLEGNDDFEIDTAIPHKLQITVAPDGFLKRVG